MNLLNAPPISSTADIPPAEVDLPIKTGDYTRTEVEVAIQSLKNSKAPGIDSVLYAETIKYGGERLLDKLVTLLNLVKNNLVIPNEWKTFICVPLPKKGDTTKMSNYRGITLMSITAKLYNRLLLNRIRDPLEEILRVNQAGFRPGRGCVEQIHLLRRILEGVGNQNLPFVGTFVDFSKAFDSIARPVMFRILRHYGVPDNVCKEISVLYSGTKSLVLVDGEMPGEFVIKIGVLQGDTFLFVTVLELGFTMIPRRSQRHPAEKINDLDFADDNVELEESLEKAQSQLDLLSLTAKEVGLYINTTKTKNYYL